MRIGIVSDTHGFIDPAVLTATRSCELLIHAGDIGNAEVLRALRRSGARVVAVRGNNDDRRRWPKAQASTLQRLPRESALELPGGQLVVVHGDRLLPASRRHEACAGAIRRPGRWSMAIATAWSAIARADRGS